MQHEQHNSTLNSGRCSPQFHNCTRTDIPSWRPVTIHTFRYKTLHTEIGAFARSKVTSWEVQISMNTPRETGRIICLCARTSIRSRLWRKRNGGNGEWCGNRNQEKGQLTRKEHKNRLSNDASRENSDRMSNMYHIFINLGWTMKSADPCDVKILLRSSSSR